METIADNKTGWLRDPEDVQAWSDVMSHALGLTDGEIAKMGLEGEKRVRELFGRDKMAERLDESIREIVDGEMGSSGGARLVVLGLFVVLSVASAVVVGWGMGLLRR